MEYGALPQRISYPLEDISASTVSQPSEASLRDIVPKPGPGAGPWSQRSAPPAQAAEGWREVRREDQNASQCMVLILSPRIRRPLRPRHAVLALSPARLRLLRPIGPQTLPAT